MDKRTALFLEMNFMAAIFANGMPIGNLSKLTHALAVQRTGSVTSAAQAVGSTQSTITKSLAALEDDIGFSLFHRHARGMDVTEEGEEFLTRASRIVADFDALNTDISTDRNERQALLRLCITPASLQGLHNPAIRKLATTHPDVRVHLSATSPERGSTLLQRGDIDLLIGPWRPMQTKADLHVERLPDVHPRFFVRTDHPLTQRQKIEPAHLVAFPIVAPDLTSSQTSELHEVFAGEGIAEPERQLHIVDYFPLVTEMVRVSDMVGIVSEEYAASSRFQDRFAVLPLSFIKPYQLCVAWRKRWLPSPSMRAFLSMLRA